MSNKFDIALQQLGQPVGHTECDLATVFKLLSKLYNAGTIGYLATTQHSLRDEVVLQLRAIDELYWADKVAQRMSGKVWERPAFGFGLPLE